MKNSVYDSSSFWASRRSHRASERERVSFAHPYTFLGSIVAASSPARELHPNLRRLQGALRRPEHLPGGGATVVMSAAQCATFTLAAATFAAGRGGRAKEVALPVNVVNMW
jgi:hypothetical protein